SPPTASSEPISCSRPCFPPPHSGSPSSARSISQAISSFEDGIRRRRPTRVMRVILRRHVLQSMFALALAACTERTSPSAASSDGGPALTSIKFQLDWVPEPEFGGFYAARNDGAFAKEGLDVTIAGGGAGVPVVQMVAMGKADFGIAGADEVLIARA